MSSPRETKVLKTPSGKELVMKTYITPREQRPIRNIYLRKKEEDVVADDVEDTLIKALVVSYDGREDALEALLSDAPLEDMTFVLKECRVLMGEKKEDEAGDPKKPQT